MKGRELNLGGENTRDAARNFRISAENVAGFAFREDVGPRERRDGVNELVINLTKLAERYGITPGEIVDMIEERNKQQMEKN